MGAALDASQLVLPGFRFLVVCLLFMVLLEGQDSQGLKVHVVRRLAERHPRVWHLPVCALSLFPHQPPRYRGALFFGPGWRVTRNKLTFRDNLQQLLADAVPSACARAPRRDQGTCECSV